MCESKAHSRDIIKEGATSAASADYTRCVFRHPACCSTIIFFLVSLVAMRQLPGLCSSARLNSSGFVKYFPRESGGNVTRGGTDSIGHAYEKSHLFPPCLSKYTRWKTTDSSSPHVSNQLQGLAFCSRSLSVLCVFFSFFLWYRQSVSALS